LTVIDTEEDAPRESFTVRVRVTTPRVAGAIQEVVGLEAAEKKPAGAVQT
jgi:hypothetical protein